MKNWYVRNTREFGGDIVIFAVLCVSAFLFGQFIGSFALLFIPLITV